MDDPTHREHPDNPQEIAAYVADLTSDLARMARRHGLDVLGYLLDMARLEARSAAGEFEPKDVSAN